MPNETPLNSSKSGEPSSTGSGLKATQLLKIIPEFHGKAQENVHEFLDAADEAFKLVKAEEQPILIAFLRTRLKNSAFKAVQYLNVDSWAELREHLQRRFGVGDSIRFIEKEFTLLNQGPRESVAEFGERTCNLAAKITEYNVREKKYDADMFEKIMEDRILVQFTTGLREPTRFQVKTYKCSDYREALSIACNLEKEQQSQRDFDGRNFLQKKGLSDGGSYESRPKCFHCGKSNHRSSECYRRRAAPSPINVRVVTCYNCQKPGHIAKDCRSRKRFDDSKFGPKTPNPNQGNESRPPATSQAGWTAKHFK